MRKRWPGQPNPKTYPLEQKLRRALPQLHQTQAPKWWRSAEKWRIIHCSVSSAESGSEILSDAPFSVIAWWKLESGGPEPQTSRWEQSLSKNNALVRPNRKFRSQTFTCFWLSVVFFPRSINSLWGRISFSSLFGFLFRPNFTRRNFFFTLHQIPSEFVFVIFVSLSFSPRLWLTLLLLLLLLLLIK